ncbi:MAG TPA: hypothetical protein PLH19_16330 [Anaerolineae bacterium]|nr:hypothetical protein [Anaerolineae bacterium]HQH40082.1 hypothetical protein [Anaerolineae bacterium]
MEPTQNSSIVLQTDHLVIEIAPAGSVYRGTRFDWTGFITQVTLDGIHTFCVPESRVPGEGTGGVGLCNEFGIEEVIGYDEATPGEAFPKLGIGLLARPDEKPYNFFRPYEIVAPFPIHVTAKATRAKFVVDPVDCRGYAVRLTKVITVKGAELTLAYTLENVGEKPIVTTEYVHNFMGIDGHALGPDYRLRMPYTMTFSAPPEPYTGQVAQMMAILDVQGSDIRCQATPEHPFYCRPLGFARTDAAQWELLHEPTGVGMREYDDFAPVRVVVWGTTHVISAEVFAAVNVQPGKTQHWTRRYEFFA